MGNSDGITRRQAIGYGTTLAAGAVAATAASPSAASAAVSAEAAGALVLRSVSLDQAQRIIAAAERRAAQIGVAMFIVVVDACGDVKASSRMDGNGPGSTVLAPRKAVTALSFRRPTDELAAGLGGDVARVTSFTSADFSLLGGGVPIVKNETVIGAVGVGGGSAEQDKDVALAGIAAITS